MFATIPYYPAQTFEFNLFGVAIDSWSLLVSIGFIVGLEFGRARAINLKLDIRDVVDGALFIVGMGFLFGHLVHVLAYNPHLIDEQGWIILAKVWAGFSSNGGFLGAILGTIIWFNWIRKREFWLHADTIAYGLPFGWFIGRLGCFTAHDHIGKKSDFFLAVDFKSEAWFRASERKFENLDPELFLRKPQGCPDTEGLWDNCLVYLELGPRHDLGLYEAIYVFGIALLFWFLRKKKLHYSSFAALFCLLYAPARFTLDFLRNTDLPNSDIRWSGFTPAQYGSMLLFLAGIVLLTRMKKKGRYTYRWELEPEESDALPQPDKAEVEKEEHSPAIPDSEDS